MKLKVRKPYDRIVDEALAKGFAEAEKNELLYFSRCNIEPEFNIKKGMLIVGRLAVEKSGEDTNYTHYRKLQRRWQ